MAMSPRRITSGISFLCTEMTFLSLACGEPMPPRRTMMTLDLPHSPGHDGSFLLSINESAPLHFPSRISALAYASKLAWQREQQGLDYAINVEGGDGKWRLFRGVRRLRA